jgi:hypothetical protein
MEKLLKKKLNNIAALFRSAKDIPPGAVFPQDYKSLLFETINN